MAVLSLIRPNHSRVEAVATRQATEPFSYTEVGGTRESLPSGFHIDHQTRQLGQGQRLFKAGVDALRRWSQFDLGWVWPLRRDVPIEAGQSFTFLSRSFGVWSINVCRVVYVIDEADEAGARFGFAYGTVGAHAVRGEERFLLTWDRATDAVDFEILKFSTPAHLLLTLLGPITRAVQMRFTREALARLAAEVAT